MPEPVARPRQRKLASDGAEYGLRSRLLDVDPLDQSISLEMHAELWRDGALQTEEVYRLDARYYFKNELLMLIERAGFEDVVVHGDHVEADPTPDDDFIVFVARK